MFDLEVFILELSAVDGLASSAVVVGEISTLSHELVDDAMESGVFVAKSFFSSAESSEVFGGLGNNIAIELESDSLGFTTTDADIKVDSRPVGHLNIFQKRYVENINILQIASL